MKSNDHDLRHSTGKNSEMSLLVRTYANPGISYPLAGRHFDQRHIGDSVQNILRFEAGDPTVVPALEWETLETFVAFGGAVCQQTVREVARGLADISEGLQNASLIRQERRSDCASPSGNTFAILWLV